MTAPLTRPEHDWYAGEIPENVVFGEHVWIDSTYGFDQFMSVRDPGLVMDYASGAYDATEFDVGQNGQVRVGAYTCLNSAHLICNLTIAIGTHCLVAWGTVITDSWIGPNIPTKVRKEALRQAASDPLRRLPASGPLAPVVLEDHVWVGFDSVILPGVTLGRGCVVGCKTVVDRDVPPGAIVAGNPYRITRFLEPGES